MSKLQGNSRINGIRAKEFRYDNAVKRRWEQEARWEKFWNILAVIAALFAVIGFFVLMGRIDDNTMTTMQMLTICLNTPMFYIGILFCLIFLYGADRAGR